MFGEENHMTTASIIGIYPVPAAEQCHLVEIMIHDGEGLFDVGEITQEDTSQPADNWQVPYDERIISADGSTILTEPFEAQEQEEGWMGDFRLGFFFHHLDPSKPLLTPFGELQLPESERLPDRLQSFAYEEP